MESTEGQDGQNPVTTTTTTNSGPNYDFKGWEKRDDGTYVAEFTIIRRE